MATASSGETRGCVFCEASVPADSSSLTVYGGMRCFVILNKYPYSNGHLMVVPHRHVGALADATSEELHELVGLTRSAEIALTEAYEPEGFNIGMNLGRPAGAGVPGHLHVHVVPRWSGDTNFMTVTAETRVVPEALDATAARLRPIFARVAAG